MNDADCIFCKIVSGEIPATITYTDEHVVAFLDVHPKAPGHTLVVPREHHAWFYDVPDELYTQVFLSAKKLY
jgi:histidine triad (HIT) family protein